jgi:hypothetical protein
LVIPFIFIAGWGDQRKSYVCSLGQRRCPHCHHKAEWEVYQIDERATAYFVPVWTYSSKRVVVCSRCGAGSQISDSQLAELWGLPLFAVSGHSQIDNFLAMLCEFAVKQSAIEAAHQKAARRRESRKGVRELVRWLEELSARISEQGYAEAHRDVATSWHEPVLVQAYWLRKRTRQYVCLMDTPASAMRQRIDFQERADAAEALRQGRLRLALQDRLLFVVVNDKRLPRNCLGEWMRTVGPLIPPQAPSAEKRKHHLRLMAALADHHL